MSPVSRSLRATKRRQLPQLQLQLLLPLQLLLQPRPTWTSHLKARTRLGDVIKIRDQIVLLSSCLASRRLGANFGAPPERQFICALAAQPRHWAKQASERAGDPRESFVLAPNGRHFRPTWSSRSSGATLQSRPKFEQQQQPRALLMICMRTSSPELSAERAPGRKRRAGHSSCLSTGEGGRLGGAYLARRASERANERTNERANWSWARAWPAQLHLCTLKCHRSSGAVVAGWLAGRPTGWLAGWLAGLRRAASELGQDTHARTHANGAHAKRVKNTHSHRRSGASAGRKWATLDRAGQ